MSQHVLLIEDDPGIAQMYEQRFEAEDLKISIAPNGETGLEMAEKLKPDLVLLDIMMPEMNGDEMLRRMRRTDWGKDIKVIIFTNLNEQDIPPDVAQLGVITVLQKASYTPGQVADIIKNILTP